MNRMLRIMAATLMVAFVGGIASGQTFNDLCTDGNPPPCDDTTPSLGSFKVFIHPDFQHFFEGDPNYDANEGTYQSPTLRDDTTIIGRSGPHTEDAPLLDGPPGTVVGDPLRTTQVSDDDFVTVPGDFEQGTTLLRREVHTEIVKLQLTHGSGAEVRAGAPMFGLPMSPGEVEALADLPAGDFPARGFFNVYAEVDIPLLGAGGTVYNTDPMVVTSELEDHFPPRVVYIHGVTSMVAVYFRDPGAEWEAGDYFGALLLGGHGTEFGEPDIPEFEAFMALQEDMEGIPAVTEWGLVVMTLLGLVAGTIVYRKW